MGIPIPPPWVAMAFVLACTGYVQDAAGLVVGLVSASLGRGEDAGCDVCSQLVELILKVTELDETENIDCGRLCFVGPWKGKCVETCTRIQSALLTSNAYPCVAAGFCPVEDTDADVTCRFGWRPGAKDATFLRCNPIAMCERKFPARCVVKDGIRAWRRHLRMVEQHAEQMAHAVRARPKCGTPNAGPYCVRDASGFAKLCELATWLIPLIFGTFSSIRAVETPGGDDDRQWLTFWLIFFGFSGLERFTDVLLSHFPFYFELKMALLLWLMFRRGADTTYGLVQRFLGASSALVERVLPSALVLVRSHNVHENFGELLDTMVGAAARRRRRYYLALPAELTQQHVRQREVRQCGSCTLSHLAASIDDFMQTECSSDDAVARSFGKHALTQLRLIWPHPTVLLVHVVRARGLSLAARAEGAPAEGAPAEGAPAVAEGARPPAGLRQARRLSRLSVEVLESLHWPADEAEAGRPVDAYAVLCLAPPPPPCLRPLSPPRVGLSVQLSNSSVGSNASFGSRASSESSRGGRAPMDRLLLRQRTAPGALLPPPSPSQGEAAAEAAAHRPAERRSAGPGSGRAAPGPFLDAADHDPVGTRRTASEGGPSDARAQPPKGAEAAAPEASLPHLLEGKLAPGGGRERVSASWASAGARLRSSIVQYAKKQKEICGPTPPAGAYGFAVSHVRRKANAPVWDEKFELSVRGAKLDANTGSYVCREAPFTRLRLEVWHREDHKADAFLGEVTIPLVHLMDMETHRSWHVLADPQGKRPSGLKTDAKAQPEVYLELQYR